MNINKSNTKIEFYLGSGGVGKSTISALNAVKMALEQKKVLIATFDPSLRLKDILIKNKGYDNSLLHDNLQVEILDPRRVFEELLEKVDPETSKNIKKNKLFSHLIERIQGVQEFSSLYFLDSNLKSNTYDLIIIDTPPLQNSLDFFLSPKKLKDLFESSIVKLFIADFNKNWIEKIFRKTRDIAFLTLKKLTGFEFFDQLINLMKALEKLQPIIMETLKETQIVLDSKNTIYKFITSYDTDHMTSAINQIQMMKQININVSHIIVNKFENYEIEELNQSLILSNQLNLQFLTHHLNYLKNLFEFRKNKIEDLMNQRHVKLWLVPRFLSPISTEKDLIEKSRLIDESR